MPRIQPKKSEEPHCNKCNNPLVVGENWTWAKSERAIYWCNPCNAEYQRQRKAIRNEQPPKSCERRCNRCDEILVLDANWTDALARNHRNICLTCNRDYWRELRGRPTKAAPDAPLPPVSQHHLIEMMGSHKAAERAAVAARVRQQMAQANIQDSLRRSYRHITKTILMGE